MNKWLKHPAPSRAGFSAVAMAALLAGCGGGGGSGADTSPVPEVPSAEISSSLLETSVEPVLEAATDTDDNGRVLVLFAQTAGGRVALHAVRGVPSARGQAPVFPAPEVIDAAAPYDSSATGQMGLTLSPNGNAVARWMATAPCTAQTYNTAGNCKFVYTARRLAAGGWEAPVLVGDTPGTLPKAIINDLGDVALLWPTLRFDAQNTPTLVTGVRWKAAAASQFTAPTVFDDIQTPADSDVGFTLDRLGNMVYVSLSAATAGPQTLVARRGTVSAGFGATERLDDPQGAGVARFEGIWGGVKGQVVVLWQQEPNGGLARRRSAVLDIPSQAAWQTSDRGVPSSSQRVVSAVDDDGNFFRYELEPANCVATRRSALGVWADTPLPAGMCSSANSFLSALARKGNLVMVNSVNSQWLAYDAASNTLTQSLSTQASGYLLGTASAVGGSVLLSENGVAALVSRNSFDALPSAANTTGTPGAAANLWVTYLKLP